MTKPRFPFLVLSVFLLGLVLVSWAHAEKVIVDRIVAIVDDNAIFQSDVDQTVKQLMLQRGATDLQPAERTALEEQVLDELIKSKLILAKAGRLGIEVPFSEVEKLVDQALEENKNTLGGEDAFERQLTEEGLTLDGLKQLYREQYRNRMLVERVLATDVNRRSVQVSDADLRALYDERQDNLPPRPAVVHLRTIYFGLGSSQSAKSAAQAKIDSLHSRVTSGEDFEDLARRYSDDPSAKSGGRLGALKLEDLGDQTFAKAAADLEVGEVSEPVLTTFGYHLIKMTGADSLRGEVEISHILVTVKPGDEDVQSVFEKATAVHAKLVAGAPFDSTAMQYSEDPATAPSGGDLGWLRVADLPEFFRDVLADMNEGDISHVLREPTGFRIVKLLGNENERPYRYEEVEEELRKMAEQEKTASLYDDYLARLRDEFYVDVRGE